jgi:hypothetical protein
MIVTISKKNNQYNNNYYVLEVQAQAKGFTKEEYQIIYEAMGVIVKIMQPKIYRERRKAKKKVAPSK